MFPPAHKDIDVHVFGLMVPTCVLQDIGMDVPHGQTVTIPAVKAYKSKDLWRSIGQRQLFRVMNGASAPTVKPPEPADIERKVLEEENRSLRQALEDQSKKLDSILSLLHSGVVAATKHTTAESVPDETPLFIPSVIAPDKAESHIEIKHEESEGTSLTGAAEKLRALRQKGKP